MSTTAAVNGRRPYALLAGFFVLGCLQLLATAFRPPLPSTDVAWQLRMFLLSLALLCVVGVAAALRAAGPVIPALVIAGCVLIGFATHGAAGGQGEIVSGLYLILLGLISGLILAVRWAVPVAVIGALIYVYAIVTNPRLDSWFYAFGVVALFMGVGIVVARLVGRLSEMAQSDALTGALNRAGLTAAAGLLHDLDERGHVETTVVEIDLDGFKAYNDAHGHAAGDELLAGVVRAWRHELRRTDLLARVGGDEFVIVFPSTSRAEAERLVERLRAASPAQWSAGLSTWLPGDPLPVALESADVDMYAHKPNRRGSSGPAAL